MNELIIKSLMNIHYQRCIFHIAVFQTEIFFPEEFLEDFNWIGGLFYDSEKRNENQPPQEFILCSFSIETTLSAPDSHHKLIHLSF